MAASPSITGWTGGWGAVAATSFGAMVLSWRTYAWRKVVGIVDPSWQAGLAEGFVHHLQWGPALVFTFGPYGVVDNILPFYRSTALLAVLYAIGVTWGLAALVVAALRASWGLLGAGVVAWLVVGVATSKTGYADAGGAVCLGLALGVLRCGPPDAARGQVSGPGARRANDAEGPLPLSWAGEGWVLLGLLGGLSGFQLLTKFNDGLLGLGLTAVVVVLGRRPKRRAALVAGAPLAGVALVAWVADGQSLGNVWSYIRASFSVALGYSSNMGLGTGRRAEDYFAVVIIVVLALVFALALGWRPGGGSGDRGLSARARGATASVLAGWTWATAKEGFVRHDAHDLTFFGLMLAAIALAKLERRYVAVQAASLALALAFDCIAAGTVPQQLRSPGASTAAFAHDVGAVAGLGGLAAARSALRAQLISGGSVLPPKILSLLRGRTVGVEPVDAAVAYVYPQLAWDPEPVLQGYTAYTTYLDRLNASFLASPKAPERLLYQPGATIDGRDPWLDPPQTIMSMYCHYRQIGGTGTGEAAVQVLAQAGGAAGRCGLHAHPLGSVRAHFGTAIEVPPAPGQLVLARLFVPSPFLVDVEGVLLKPPPLHLMVWTGGQHATRYRFVPGTAPDFHVVSAPKALGFSPAFTPPAITRFALTGGGWRAGTGTLTVSFYAVTVRPGLASRRRA